MKRSSNSNSNSGLRVVLDTNVLVSALVFTGGLMGHFRKLWMAEKILPFTSKEAVQELIRVLANPKFKLNPVDQRSLLADYVPFAGITKVSANAPRASLPVCRDPLDQIFLELAQASQADVLVTGDMDLLALADTPKLSFRILKPIEFLTQYSLTP